MPTRSKSQMSNPFYVYDEHLERITNNSELSSRKVKSKSDEDLHATFEREHPKSIIDKSINDYKVKIAKENMLRERMIKELLLENENISKQLLKSSGNVLMPTIRMN